MMAITRTTVEARQTRRAHVYELDLLRTVTALCVVAVHVLAFTILYNTSALGTVIQHGAEASMHFTREVFMFMTALVLVYTYRGKPFDTKTFWRKRGVGVVLPYVLWSVFYTVANQGVGTPLAFARTTGLNILSGNASFQLYYILLTIQLYALFPLLLWMLPALDCRRWLTLGVSGALELAGLALDYHLLQRGPATSTSLGGWLVQYQDRFVLVYQFYFILGALCALHLDRLRALARQRGRLIAAALGVALLAFWVHYAVSLGVSHDSVGYAIAVLQPIMVVYSLAVLAFLWWIACRWAASPGASGEPRAARGWRTLADASFGVYLVHPIFIGLGMAVAGGVTFAPAPVRVALVWLIAATGSCLLSVLLMRTPILARLVGRATPLPLAIAQRLAAWLAALRVRDTTSVSMRGAWAASPPDPLSLRGAGEPASRGRVAGSPFPSRGEGGWGDEAARSRPGHHLQRTCYESSAPVAGKPALARSSAGRAVRREREA